MTAILITCEHGGNRIPAAYRKAFAKAGSALASHRGWDPGALRAARRLARAFGAELRFTTVSRLLVEPNRSLQHPRIFSEFVRGLDAETRRGIVERYYHPYREDIERRIAALVDRGRRVLHLSVHSFTPVLHGEVRTADVGLLYDPARSSERAFCAAWKHELERIAPRLRVRRNYPYRGRDDGLTSHLRARFPVSRYLGLELELNHGLLDASGRWPQALIGAVEESLGALIRA